MLIPTNLPLKHSLQRFRDYDEWIATWVSHVVSPHIVGVVLTASVALTFDPQPLATLGWLLLLLPLIVLPPLSYLIWLVRRGRLVDIYMPDRESRLVPLTVLLFWLLVCLSLMRTWQAPLIVEVFVLATIVLIGILGLITLFWKISFHGATITAATTATLVVAGPSAWPVMLLIPLVGWARVRLKRHTPRQVIYGSLVGAVIALILTHSLLLRLV